MAHEFYSTSPRAGYGAVPQHHISAECVEAAEILRTHFNTQWRITSTYRNKAHETAIIHAQGKEYFLSQHELEKAFDSQPANGDPAILAAMQADFFAGGELYQKLRRAGITGFGVYDTFVHLDSRNNQFAAQRSDKFGMVAWWDSRKVSEEKKSWGGVILSPKAKSRPRLAENQGEVIT